MTAQTRLPLLFLCHRIPFPPNKGDKIRAFHLLQHLSQHFDIHLGTFVDDPDDWAWCPKVEAYCASSHFEALSGWRATLGSLRGLLTGAALSLPYYRSRGLSQWVNQAVERHGIRHVLVYSSAMTQFLPIDAEALQRRVIDFVDVDSDKWLQYARNKPWPLSWIYRREGRCLLAHEQAVIRDFDAGFFVSEPEAALFRTLAPQFAHKVGHFNNGVDTKYFQPDDTLLRPFSSEAPVLVFTGAMDYWPNIDAVTWFAAEMLPAIRARVPGVEFYIVGSSPSPAVQRLASLQGVTVTGRVADVRPYQQHASAVVAPMRVARGVQNKVLEGMAMAKPVLVTQKGLEGIRGRDGHEILLAESADDYADCLEALLAGKHPLLGEAARQCIEANFRWESSLPEVTRLLNDVDRIQ